ncbi:MAG: PA0069 family radical SAM protein [Candidatus Xenobia bacterium]
MYSMVRGRGAASNPANRFERIEITPDEEAEPLPPGTELYADSSKSVISTNNSPDVGFSASVNPYRGCEHGCIYCYARPTHEYFGLSLGLDFETRIMVKQNAPELLRAELASPRWTPQVLAMSGVTDCYQPAERHLRLTRGCLDVLLEYRNPVSVITKNHLVTRDVDLLAELASHRAAAVSVSVTTLDADLAGRMEPRASRPQRRLEAIAKLAAAGIPVGVMVAPVVPGLTDSELPAILQAAAQAGAQRAGYVMLRLPHGLPELFEDWLERFYPQRRQKVLNHLRDVRGGRLNDPRFGSRMRGEGLFAEQVQALFRIGLKKAGLTRQPPPLSTAAFRRPAPGGQLSLFD